jgi:hypothetical protein
LASLLCDLDEIEDDALLEPENKIEIAKSDVCVDEYDALSGLRQSCAEIDGRRRLANTAFS